MITTTLNPPYSETSFPVELIVTTISRRGIPPYGSDTETTRVSLIDICKAGKFYCPASDHYLSDMARVTCNVCRSEDISACFGYMNKFDICLTCAKRVT